MVRRPWPTSATTSDQKGHTCRYCVRLLFHEIKQYKHIETIEDYAIHLCCVCARAIHLAPYIAKNCMKRERERERNRRKKRKSGHSSSERSFVWRRLLTYFSFVTYLLFTLFVLAHCVAHPQLDGRNSCHIGSTCTCTPTTIKCLLRVGNVFRMTFNRFTCKYIFHFTPLFSVALFRILSHQRPTVVR